MVEREVSKCNERGVIFISKHYVNVKVNDEIHKILKEYSEHLGVTQAFLVRCALRFYFKTKGLLK